MEVKIPNIKDYYTVTFLLTKKRNGLFWGTWDWTETKQFKIKNVKTNEEAITEAKSRIDDNFITNIELVSSSLKSKPLKKYTVVVETKIMPRSALSFQSETRVINTYDIEAYSSKKAKRRGLIADKGTCPHSDCFSYAHILDSKEL